MKGIQGMTAKPESFWFENKNYLLQGILVFIPFIPFIPVKSGYRILYACKDMTGVHVAKVLPCRK
jgi:hypothetical protein